MTKIPRAIHLKEMTVRCTLCDWTKTQIGSSIEECERVLDPLMDAHVAERHPEIDRV